MKLYVIVWFVDNKEVQKKLLTEEHNFDEALKKALGARPPTKMSLHSLKMPLL